MTKEDKIYDKQFVKNTKYGKTCIIVTEHFLQQGKTLEELLTDIIIEKVKQTAV